MQKSLQPICKIRAKFVNQTLFFNQQRFYSSETILHEIRKFNNTSKSGPHREKQIHHLMDTLFQEITSRPLDQPIFLQSVSEVMNSLKPFLLQNPKYLELIPLLYIPEKVHIFSVPWVDDHSVQRVNIGYRVQFNQTLGPYKGGLRFHPSVNLSVIKFLGFEQIFKNALTGLPLGAGKGGADFDPKNKSNREIFKFCKSFMTQLYPYIGADVDVPAGDIGVGSREIGYLYGQYKSITHKFSGVLTGKKIGWGGSFLRPEATGFGLVYITRHHLVRSRKRTLENLRCAVSGSGNVAQYTALKLVQLGAKVLSLSDSSGAIYCEKGLEMKDVEKCIRIKNERGRISEMASLSNNNADGRIVYHDGKSVWEMIKNKRINLAFPCATQNEIGEKEAVAMVKNCGVEGVFEGANMPCSNEAIKVFMDGKVDYIPGKAANAGGVAVSCLEMAQNSARMVWKEEKVDRMLEDVMVNIYEACYKAAMELGYEGNIQLGANTVGFKRVADGMFEQGLVFQPEK